MLAEGVGKLCNHMQDLRVKEVASIAEERLQNMEARLSEETAAQLNESQQRMTGTYQQLAMRLQSLEAAVQQEQQSSLKALQAILNSSSHGAVSR